jgi:hypothetical protein
VRFHSFPQVNLSSSQGSKICSKTLTKNLDNKGAKHKLKEREKADKKEH